MRAECYLLHITCDHAGCFRRSYEYTGRDIREAHAMARSEGWKIGKVGKKDFCKEHRRSLGKSASEAK